MRRRDLDDTQPCTPCLPAMDDPIWRLGHGAVAFRLDVERLGGTVTASAAGALTIEAPEAKADDVAALLAAFIATRKDNDKEQPR